MIGVATAAHQAFSANLYTLPSDLFPRSAVGSVIGIGGTAGAVGGMIFALAACGGGGTPTDDGGGGGETPGLGPGASLNGRRPFPSDHPWNQDVS